MRLKGLDGIRALCALFVLWGHMAQKDFVCWDITPLHLPECAAYVFFSISGVLAGFRIDTIQSPGVFYFKKARRILPLYYSYILITIVVFLSLGRASEVFNIRLLYYLFLVPSIPFILSQGILPLVHLWFIGTLLLFYLSVPLFARLNESKRRFYALTIATIWFAIKLLAKIFEGGVAYRFIACTCFDVLYLGVWCGLLLKDGKSIEGVKAIAISIITWCLFLSSGLYAHLIPAPIRIEYISALALIIIFTQQTKRSSYLLENRVSRFIGSISYEIYVGHILLIIVLSQFYRNLGTGAADWIIYLATTLCVVLFAYLLNVGVSALFKSHKSGASSIRQVHK